MHYTKQLLKLATKFENMSNKSLKKHSSYQFRNEWQDKILTMQQEAKQDFSNKIRTEIPIFLKDLYQRYHWQLPEGESFDEWANELATEAIDGFNPVELFDYSALQRILDTYQDKFIEDPNIMETAVPQLESVVRPILEKWINDHQLLDPTIDSGTRGAGFYFELKHKDIPSQKYHKVEFQNIKDILTQALTSFAKQNNVRVPQISVNGNDWGEEIRVYVMFDY